MEAGAFVDRDAFGQAFVEGMVVVILGHTTSVDPFAGLGIIGRITAREHSAALRKN
jgi:hypothetical protein